MPEMRAGRTGARETGREIEVGGRREGMGGGGRFSAGGCAGRRGVSYQVMEEKQYWKVLSGDFISYQAFKKR